LPIAVSMLDFGFANYALYSEPEYELENVDVIKGVKDEVAVYSKAFAKLINKADKKGIEKEYSIPDSICAPLKNGDVIGKVVYKLNGEIIGQSELYVKEDIAEIKVKDLFLRMLKVIFTGKY